MDAIKWSMHYRNFPELDGDKWHWCGYLESDAGHEILMDSEGDAKVLMDIMNRQQQRISDLEAENARLREALQIAINANSYPDMPIVDMINREYEADPKYLTLSNFLRHMMTGLRWEDSAVVAYPVKRDESEGE